MSESGDFWDLYWDIKLQPLQELGKKEAILAISRLIRRLTSQPGRSLRMVELGCGEGQIIGALFEGHSQALSEAIGIDYLPASLQTARRTYPGVHFIEGDFTNQNLLGPLGQFDIVLMVNALHEVFSAGYSDALGETDVPAAREKVELAFAGAARMVAPGGYMALFDGLEPSGDPSDRLRVRFLSQQARELFETFAREYRPFRISYQATGTPYQVELPRRDFTRYITKSIFLGKSLWNSERLESYQYYTEADFRRMFSRQGLEIQELHTLTVDEEKWRRSVEILTPGATFPEEHILIIANKNVPESQD